MRRQSALVASAFVLALACADVAQAQDERSTGLPFASEVDWTFNVDAGLGVFGFGNSLFTNPHPEPSGDLSDNWWEGFVKPALSATHTLGEGEGESELYGKVSVVGVRTFGVSPDLVGGDANSYGFEDAYLGWRSGTLLSGLGEDAVDITVGRSQYQLGTGFLLWDGAGDGGGRGGYWSNPRRAFAFSGIGRLNTGPHKLELFYLDKNEDPVVDADNRLWGANYELGIADRLTLGATYMGWTADPDEAPQRDGLDVYNFRLSATPLGSVPLSLEGEYAIEQNGDALDSEGWYAQAAYELENVGWTPRLSYRYALFAGDDPDTAANEAFDPLFLGFYDWGTWWQGEIAGEYFLSNSNLASHQVRLHLTPGERVIGAGLMAFVFTVDEPASFGSISDDIGFEVDGYLDWAINDNFLASFVAAWATPGDAITEAYGRTDDFVYGMIYLAYSY